jgi:putative CocE/NonD family hydrolase
VSVFRPSTVDVLNDVPVPMRDGVRLSADVYFPANGSGPWPVLLARTPYDNNLLMDLGFFWTQHGYVYVAQNVRGRYDSEGVFVSRDHETDDGYDTLE